jgi:hypothetical protein
MITHDAVKLVETSFPCVDGFTMPALVMIPENSQPAPASRKDRQARRIVATVIFRLFPNLACHDARGLTRQRDRCTLDEQS